MPRTYSFDHFTAARPVVSPFKRASSHEKQTPMKGEAHASAGGLHYGHAHALTEELYKKHRQEQDLRAATRIPDSPRQPSRAPQEASVSEEPLNARAEEREGFGREELKELAQGAVGSVMQAAREVVRGRPLVGARKLAGDAVSGTLRVARQVSARITQEPGKKD